ncbi:hypothetical protein [Micromonospora rosaria]|nr:hypothetical protein [Micromonospora rosaria]
MTVGTAAPASADGYVNTFIQIFNLDIRCFLARDSLNANLPANTPPDTYYYCVENSVPYSHSYYALWYRHWVD